MAISLMFDISGKQKYIFSTAMLRSIVGASARMDLLNLEFQERFGEELVYSGGGNGAAVFDSEARMEEARGFLRECAGTLGLALPCVEKEIAGSDISWDELEQLKVRIAEEKRKARVVSAPFNMPMASQCQVCGQGAALVKEVEGRKVCQRCREKLVWNTSNDSHGNRASSAHQWLANLVYQRDAEELFLLDLSEMPKAYKKWLSKSAYGNTDSDRNGKEERSLMAVVCMDGNGMGRRINALRAEGKKTGRTPREMLTNFSNGVEALLKEALACSMRDVFGKEIPRNTKLPFRPLIAAGDDICFVIAPELALDFTRRMAHYFNATSQTTATGLRGVTLSAGIAVVHNSFPVVEAVGLAEELLSSAKKGGQACAADGMPPAMVDFAVVLDAKMDSLARRRQRESVFTGPDGTRYTLTRKPYRLNESGDTEHPCLGDLEGKVIALQQSGMARSKIKELRDILREGRNEREDRLKPYRRDRAWTRLEPLLGWHRKETEGQEVKEAFLDLVEIYDFMMSQSKESTGLTGKEH